MDLALKDIRRHLGKFFATTVGVGMLLAIVLVMNGIYRGNIFDGIWLIDNTAADLWVVEQGRGGPFNESSRLPADAHKSVAARAANGKRLERAGYSDAEAAKLLPLLAGSTATVNAVLVEVSKGNNVEAVRAHIERWLHFSAYTTNEERDLMLEGRLKKMSAVLGLFRSLLVVVSIVIIALIVYVLTIEKIRPIAMLKLIGAPNHVIVRMILEQSLLLTLGSFAVAYGLMSLVRDRFPRTLILLPEEILITFAVMLAGGVVASFMAIWHALRTPPSLALGS